MTSFDSVNKKALIQKLYNSKAWLVYCGVQLLLTSVLISYVLTDLKQQ